MLAGPRRATWRRGGVASASQSWLGNLPRYDPVSMARSEAGSTANTSITRMIVNPTKIHPIQKGQHRPPLKPPNNVVSQAHRAGLANRETVRHARGAKP